MTVLQVLPDVIAGNAAVIGGVSVVLGGVLLLYWYHSRGGTATAQQWPSTTATVTESVLGPEGERPTLEYEYEVDGATYTNDSVWAGGDTMGHSRLRSFVESSPVDTEVTVYYDPDSPSAAVVVESGRRRLGLLVLGVALVLVGAALLVAV